MIEKEMPNLVTYAADALKSTRVSSYLISFENVIFSLLIIFTLSIIAYFTCRKIKLIPTGKLQTAGEFFAAIIDDFICGILGPRGRHYTPFIGTLFIYILMMNLCGIIPLIKSPTSSWSTTIALALCVFVYVQYSAFKDMGFKGYLDHMMGKPRGVLAFSVVIPLLLFFLHLVTELIKPLSLSLRLRSNIWGDDMLLSIVAGFGFKGIPLLFFNTLLVILAGLVQALVFCLLSTIYFALVLQHEESG